MPFADANGVRLFYESVGEGVPLLFIHGGYGGAPTTLAPKNQAITTILPRDKVRTIHYHAAMRACRTKPTRTARWRRLQQTRSACWTT